MMRRSPPATTIFSGRCGVFKPEKTVKELLLQEFSLARFPLIQELSLNHALLRSSLQDQYRLNLMLKTDKSVPNSVLSTVIDRIEVEVKGDNKNGTKANFEILDFISKVDGIPDNIKNACESARHSLERYFLDYRCTPK